MKLKKSNELFERASRIIPWGTQTGAKRWREAQRDHQPAFIRKGKGCRIWDVDDNEYIDFKCALGPIILGYADDDVNEAVIRRIQDGTLYSMAHPIEIELAERISKLVPCAERVRFLKSGGDANAAAVRIARTVTKKDKMISFGYHGWNDTVNAAAPHIGGIPQACGDLVVRGTPNDLDDFKKILLEHGGNTAIVIMDIACHRDMDPAYLQAIRELCDENNILLCFDEIITGFRYALGGAQEYYGVVPDLACFAKGMANGYSISALCGKAGIMDEGFEKTVVTGTYYGATTDIAASIATIDKLERHNVPDLLWRRGKMLKSVINDIMRKYGLGIRAEGPDCIFNLAADNEEHRGLFMKLLFEHGLYPGSVYWFIQYSHTDEVLDEVAGIIDVVCSKISK